MLALRTGTQSSIKTITVGQYLELERQFTASDVAAYADVGGDHNPVHLDPEFAATTRFKACIVHGILTGGLFGTALATHLPGTIYLAQSFKFTAPLYVGDTVIARVTVKDMSHNRVAFDTSAWVGERGEAGTAAVGPLEEESDGEGDSRQYVIRGEAKCMLPAA